MLSLRASPPWGLRARAAAYGTLGFSPSCEAPSQGIRVAQSFLCCSICSEPRTCPSDVWNRSSSPALVSFQSSRPVSMRCFLPSIPSAPPQGQPLSTSHLRPLPTPISPQFICLDHYGSLADFFPFRAVLEASLDKEESPPVGLGPTFCSPNSISTQIC